MKKIVTILGIRPDFIRMCNIIKKLDKENNFEHIMIHTGQHYSKVLYNEYLKELNIRKPDILLNCGRKSKNHYELIAKMNVEVCDLMKKIKPDLIIFLGDSHSVLTAIPLKKEGYKICHIEAGMRSYDKRMPEEINRISCDHSSYILMPYHENYKNNLIKEGIKEENTYIVGNTIVEMVNEHALDFNIPKKKDYILADIHRNENIFDEDKYFFILNFLNEISEVYKMPIYLLKYPRTEKITKKMLLNLKNITFLKNENKLYRGYLNHQYHSYFLISDSGSAQEESPLLNTPVIVPRNFTERPESMEFNHSCLINEIDIYSGNGISIIKKFIDKYYNDKKKKDISWLGDGTTSLKVINTINKVKL